MAGIRETAQMPRGLHKLKFTSERSKFSSKWTLKRFAAESHNSEANSETQNEIWVVLLTLVLVLEIQSQVSTYLFD